MAEESFNRGSFHAQNDPADSRSGPSAKSPGSYDMTNESMEEIMEDLDAADQPSELADQVEEPSGPDDERDNK